MCMPVLIVYRYLTTNPSRNKCFGAASGRLVLFVFSTLPDFPTSCDVLSNIGCSHSVVEQAPGTPTDGACAYGGQIALCRCIQVLSHSALRGRQDML